MSHKICPECGQAMEYDACMLRWECPGCGNIED